MKHFAKTLACAAVMLAGVVSLLANHSRAADPDQRVYEMRVYYAAEGKLDALNARFRDHTLKLFEKHRITNVGYWMPIENPERMLVYLLSYPSRDARDQSWKAFMADPDWQKAHKASEVDGKLVSKVEVTFLQATDYSPEIKTEAKGDRVFEMRTYTAAPGKLDALNARFQDHTVELFEKHGITNIGYWTPMGDQKGADNTLIYIIAHKSREGAKEAFASFGKDPAWRKALKESEQKAGGSLTVPGGVQSVFMEATDYSPIR